MSSERGRGVLLYLLFVVLLSGGGLWFFRFAPASTSGRRIEAWRDSAANLLPDRPLQIRADTIVMTGGSTQRSESVGAGSYTLSMVCLGERGRIRVRLSTSGDDDSGRGVPCAQAPRPVSLPVGLADDFFMDVSAETDGSIAVFRWRLDHAPGF